mmetsp:Transcript_50912/g.134157  ORF Transcript_50912/g.134157 Transcript_50912/m.134157 type:complete len:344 (-) Transcript_50912:173-1204(-)
MRRHLLRCAAAAASADHTAHPFRLFLHPAKGRAASQPHHSRQIHLGFLPIGGLHTVPTYWPVLQSHRPAPPSCRGVSPACRVVLSPFSDAAPCPGVVANRLPVTISPRLGAGCGPGGHRRAGRGGARRFAAHVTRVRLRRRSLSWLRPRQTCGRGRPTSSAPRGWWRPGAGVGPSGPTHQSTKQVTVRGLVLDVGGNQHHAPLAQLADNHCRGPRHQRREGAALASQVALEIRHALDAGIQDLQERPVGIPHHHPLWQEVSKHRLASTGGEDTIIGLSAVPVVYVHNVDLQQINPPSGTQIGASTNPHISTTFHDKLPNTSTASVAEGGRVIWGIPSRNHQNI